MAKKANTFWRAASVIVTLVILAVGIVVTFTKALAASEAVGDKVQVVKTEGCLPARKATTDVSVLQAQFKNMETVQTSRHTEIMTALGKKPAPP